MQKLSKNKLIWASILIAWIFDQILWRHHFGVSFLILVVIVMVTGYLLARSSGVRPAKSTWLLVPVILFFAVMTIFRSEPLTVLLNVTFVISLLSLAAVTYAGGLWWNYSISDYFMKAVSLVVSAFSRAILFATRQQGKTESEDLPRVEPKSSGKFWAVVRGLIISFPILLTLAFLLGSADPIFNKELERILSVFQIERLGEYLFRLFYILVLAYLLVGVYLHAITRSQDEKLVGLGKPWLSRFFGSTEAFILLGGINLLFLIFVFIQFRYFFGGQSNIHIDGYTYAEYARKGFAELVAVAVITLVILQVLSTITRRETRNNEIWFSSLGVGLVALVCVILVSAFQRLQLYELAYGYSRTRLYSHIFTVWLGVLLIATVAIEITRKQRAFALVVLLTGIGYGATLNLINVDHFITARNIERGNARQELDVAYLVSLSDDNVPLLAKTYQKASADSRLKSDMGASLICRLDTYEKSREQIEGTPRADFWGSYTYTKHQAGKILTGLAQDLRTNFTLITDETTYYREVKTPHGLVPCEQSYGMD